MTRIYARARVLRVLWWIRIYECPRGCHSVQPYTVYTPSARFIFFGFFGSVLYHIIETLSLTTDRAMALLWWGSAPDPVGGSPPPPPKGLRRMSMVRVVKWCCEYGAARSRRTEEIRCLKHRKTFSYWRLRFDHIYNERWRERWITNFYTWLESLDTLRWVIHSFELSARSF